VKVLLTGATGDIGRQMLPALGRAGHEVVALRRRRMCDDGGARRPTADLVQGGSFDELPAGLDVVIHLAGKRYEPGARSSVFVRANVELTARLLEAVGRTAAGGRPHILFASTIYVYGERSERPFAEDDPPRPATAYGASKLEAEQRIAAACRERNIPFTILRLPAVYGTGGQDIFTALARVFGRLVPFVIGDGQQRRSLVSVFNFARIVLVAMANPRWYGATVNVADPGSYRIADLAGYVAGSRRVRRLRSAWVDLACGVRPLARIPAYLALCDGLRRFGDSFELDTTRLDGMGAGPLDRLPLPV
jgi:nucleoside-diphosphate-sugar epimerase